MIIYLSAIIVLGKFKNLLLKNIIGKYSSRILKTISKKIIPILL